MQHTILVQLKKRSDLFKESVIARPCRGLLHPDVAEYIVEEAERTKRNQDLQIIIQFTEEENFNLSDIAPAVQKHFDFEREKATRHLKKTITLGLESLLIGFAFLIAMFLLTKTLMKLLPESALMITMREFFIILAWVALWRPAELLLYDWRSDRRSAKLFHRISTSAIKVIS